MEEKKQTWIEKARETQKFHREMLRSHDGWRIGDTAKSLKRSSGSISEDLLIAKWLKTHSTQLEKYDYAYQALEFIREEMNDMRLEE